MSSRRKFTRVPTEVMAQAKPGSLLMFEGKILNLSEGGAFLSSQQKVGIGSQLMLTLNLEVKGQTKSCLVHGKVAWSNQDPKQGPLGYGVQFLECPASTMKILRDYLNLALGNEVNASGPITPPTRGQLRG